MLVVNRAQAEALLDLGALIDALVLGTDVSCNGTCLTTDRR